MKLILKLALAMLAALVLLLALVMAALFGVSHWPPWEKDPAVILPDHNSGIPRPGTFFDND